ncbi:MAG: hypothetical protein DRI65_06635 [Chloroflexota bacterium]|nr:MAG: hypothetical protein DRI65_06635 [Chloroflexota bacterium]
MKHIQIIEDAFAVYGKQYSSLGDYSATTLISPPRLVQLGKRYGDKVENSVESQIASLVGTGVHEKVEKLLHLANVKNPDYMLERSVVHPFEVDGETRLVAGKFDILRKKKDLFDIKTAKTWKLIFDPDMVDWHEQQNIYAYLLHMRGIDVETINILAFYLDWIESNAIRNKGYPQAPIVQYNLKLWSHEEQREFIIGKLKKHVAAEDMSDSELPVCTAEEMWERPPTYAIMKNKIAKRANRVFKNATFAEVLEAARGMKGLNTESFIESRHNVRTRCEKYCAINSYCNVYQDYQARKQNIGLNTIYQLGGLL